MKHIALALAAALALAGCSSTRHVPADSYMLDNARIVVDDSTRIPTKRYYNYLRQLPNHKVLGFARLQLGIYNMSGSDSTGRFNRWLRKVGEEPVIFDSALTDQSARQLRQALINEGYLDAQVDYDVTPRKKKKIDVTYRLHPGKPFVVNSIAYEFEEPGLEWIVYSDSMSLPMKTGGNLDLNILDNQRTLVAEWMRENGYFAFTKEDISFVADTVAGQRGVDLTMVVHKPRQHAASADTPAPDAHERYAFRRVVVVPDFSPGDNTSDFSFAHRDTVNYQGLEILYGPDPYLKPQALAQQIFIRPDEYYSTSNIDKTYEALNRLAILRYVNILTRPAGKNGDTEMLDAYILLSRTKKMGVTLELEGTNSEGDFGVGGGVTYQHRNLARGGEMLTFKLRGAYESLSGDFEDLINDSYTEVASEVGITFPKFMAPFLHSSFKHRMRASTEFALTFVRQERPEYTRIIAGGAWRYKWAARSGRTRRTLDLIDINVVNLPRSTINFIDNIAPDNPLLRYSYEDHFIMRMGYTYHRTNRQIASGNLRTYRLQPSVYSLRASAETAGNLLYAISSLSGQHRKDGMYTLFGIQYSQYAKMEVDYSLTRNLNRRHALAFHAGFGIGVPYGNSRVLPFEKRFYAGGANGVRGWGVRTLGPGSFDSKNSVTDFINQCGDIRLDLSAEYRAKLFWVFEGAAFIDAGNIWTIHNYENQPGGMFRFDSFWKQIAVAYGIGLRMDFSYFLLRFDLGLKAYNPAENQERWPLIHPRWKRDTSFHFSVGYPF